MQEDFTQALTQVIELIKGVVDGLKNYLLGHPIEVFIVICILIASVVLFYYLPKILAALYKDLVQLFIILVRWAVFSIIIVFSIWTIASFSTTCGLINEHLGTKLKCEAQK
ncbi:hypothetical protein [Candidatus Albibeggiatoa sp. nov. BB20]|uniref:hypothetical protein n=1 Tax=Candidatus Albibeggiatoa sp. nov. BB20 TaxID=3162723 RepID=UPI0033658C66